MTNGLTCQSCIQASQWGLHCLGSHLRGSKGLQLSGKLACTVEQGGNLQDSMAAAAAGLL
jgi:hypothetical protein